MLNKKEHKNCESPELIDTTYDSQKYQKINNNTEFEQLMKSQPLHDNTVAASLVRLLPKFSLIFRKNLGQIWNWKILSKYIVFCLYTLTRNFDLMYEMKHGSSVSRKNWREIRKFGFPFFWTELIKNTINMYNVFTNPWRLRNWEMKTPFVRRSVILWWNWR